MSADAVALFRPKTLSKLEPFLDLDDESDESDGLYAEKLDDGTLLVHTFQPFDAFVENARDAHDWLAQFGDALPEVHHDARGLLFFPDTCEPEARTYEDVVAEVADEGVWIATDLAAADLDGLDSLNALTAGLVEAAASGTPATSFEVAKLVEGVQQQLFEALGMLQGGELDDDEEDDERDEK